MSAKAATIRKNITAFVFIIMVLFSIMPECAFADAIQDAVRGGDLQKVKAIIENDPSWIHYKSADGRTLLHWASKNMQVDVSEYLMSKGADVNARTIDNLTPLGLAVSSGVPEDNIFDIDVPRRKKMINLLIAYGAQTNTMDEAIAQDNVEIFGSFIKMNQETLEHNDLYNSALNSATCWGSARIMSFLLKNRKLALNSVDLNKPLVSAAMMGYKNIVKLLIICGADVNSRRSRYFTPMCWAVMSGNGKLFGAYYDLRDKNFHDFYAQVKYCNPEDYIETVKMLIAAGADVNTKPESADLGKRKPLKGMFLLQIAAIKGWTEMAELLLSAGARSVINEKDDVYHYTPLHHAAEQGNKALVKVLLDNGADKEIKDDQGRTPLKIAEEKGHKEIADLLQERGAKK
ncbi:MAG: ankyrin repeat domain-containing protein [Vulcanimicrobiota bacterium]